jgi:hypothetical protein
MKVFPRDRVNFKVLLALTDWLWIKARRPFFRLWPGFLEAVRTLKIENYKLSDIVIDFPDDIHSIALEMPIENPTMFGSQHLKSIFVTKFDASLCPKRYGNLTAGKCHYFISLFSADTNKAPDDFNYFPLKIDIVDSTKEMTVGEYESDLLKMSGNERDIRLYAISIAILVGLISKMKSDKPLLAPVLIRKLQEKWEQTHDVALIEKSKRNGVYGWDVGKNLPDAEQIEQMRKDAINAGMKAPHWRNPHFRRIVIGNKEDGNKEWRFVSGSFVNKDMMLEVPHGYYDKEET